MTEPSLGMGMPGMGQTSSRGTPGSEPIQNSAIYLLGIPFSVGWGGSFAGRLPGLDFARWGSRLDLAKLSSSVPFLDKTVIRLIVTPRWFSLIVHFCILLG